MGQSWDNEKINEYLCETCGTKAQLTEQQAFEAGWDYPPFIGVWGVVSPRTCGNCLIDTTAYWQIITGNHQAIVDDERHRTTIDRIMAEGMGEPWPAT